MQRIDGPSAAATRPAPRATGTGGSAPGFFARPDLEAGVAPTTLDPDWCNAVQEELINVIAAAGLTPDKGSVDQLLTALTTLFVAQGASTGVDVGATQVSLPLPGGFKLKFGIQEGSYVEQSLTINFTTAFATKCWVALPIVLNTSASLNRDVWGQIVSMSTAGFTAYLNRSGGSNNTDSNDGIVWLAIGN